MNILKRTKILLVILSGLILVSCGSMGGGFKENHGLKKKNISTVSKIKGDKKVFCHH